MILFLGKNLRSCSICYISSFSFIFRILLISLSLSSSFIYLIKVRVYYFYFSLPMVVRPFPPSPFNWWSSFRMAPSFSYWWRKALVLSMYWMKEMFDPSIMERCRLWRCYFMGLMLRSSLICFLIKLVKERYSFYLFFLLKYYPLHSTNIKLKM